MNIRRILTLAQRVFTQITHDRRTLALIFIAPIVILSLAGVLIRSEPENIALGVVNEDEGVEVPAPLNQVSLSAMIVQALRDSETFAVTELARSEAGQALESGEVKATLFFSADFSQSVRDGDQTTVQLRLEGSNPATAGTIQRELSRMVMQRLASLSASINGDADSDTLALSATGLPVQFEATFLYGGPQFDSLDYVAPVYIAFFVFFFVFLLTCVFFLRERSQGTMERLLATPINRLEIVLGYMLGLGFFALIQSAVVLLFTVYALDIDYAGSLIVVFLLEVILTMLAANMGILASTFATNEFQVVQFIPLVIFPQALLSGTIWAIESLPEWLQPFAWVMPMTYANQAMRDVMIKGQGLVSIWPELLILTAFAVLLILLGALTVRREVV
jgi:ABC-2 type transport system permease protein